jgi:transcriptional regulator with XRE-family HTH domain
MIFSHYLRACRKRLKLTQEALVEKLYHFDQALFSGLGVPTLSRWENGQSRPSYNKIRGILAYLQSATNEALPCAEMWRASGGKPLDAGHVIADNLFEAGKMVVGLPLTNGEDSAFKVVSLRHHPRADELLKLHAMLHRSANGPMTRVDEEKFAEWMDLPGNFFVAAMFEESFLGLLFALRLKPESFDRVLRFELKKNALTPNDFAPAGEWADIYLLSFFALSKMVAGHLLQRLYAVLAAERQNIGSVGMITSFDEAQRLGLELGLRTVGKTEADGHTVTAYRATLYEFMRSDMALKTLFPKSYP